ncbi:MAG: amidohydrolase family protein [Porticoccaceae bacterium]|nr:amidohydrolase family protein [Porticoccaceae bacterium]
MAKLNGFAVCSILAIVLLGCSKQPDTTELVIKNINGYTFDADRQLRQFQTIAIEEGKVLAIGDATLALKYPDAEKIDGQGKTLIPGITDAHGHVSTMGYTLLTVDVRGLESAQAAAELVGKYAAEKPALNWIQGRGWNQVLWPEKQYPRAADLDAQISDRPVWLERIDGHAGWANSKTLALAGITGETASPAGGEIVRDSNGQPTGVLIDNAMYLVTRVIPPPSNDEIALALDTMSEHLLSLGITSTHDAGVSSDEHRLYRQIADDGDMRIRIYGMISSTNVDVEETLAAGHSVDEKDLYTLRSIKVYVDGALGSRGAAMLEPYADRADHHGLLVTSSDQLRELFNRAITAEFQVAIHAIGDKGNRIALDEIEYAYGTVGGRHLRHRIEHSQVVAVDDIPRFKALDVIPSMQPTHATSDMNMAEDRIGAERLKGAYAWRSFLEQGSLVVSGSDYPIELANPFHGIHAAVTRQDHNNMPAEGWIPEEAMTLEQVLRSFTIDAAWAAHQEDRLGGLTEGKWADFILIDRDIFQVEPEKLWQTEVLETWIAGQRVYQQAP